MTPTEPSPQEQLAHGLVQRFVKLTSEDGVPSVALAEAMLVECVAALIARQGRESVAERLRHIISRIEASSGPVGRA
jgi:hypothetical protein